MKRGDLELVKVGGTDMRRLAGVPFRITSMTTGESHVIVTDANGYASTASAWNLHSANTNANDQVEWEPPLAIAAEDETTTTDEAKRGSSMSETPAEGTPDASEIPAETPENERVESGDPAVRSVEYEAETESVTIPEDVPTSESALDEAESTDDSVTVSEQTEEPEAAENVSDAIASEATEDTSQDARKRDAEPHTESEPMDEAPETEEDETRSLDNQTETVEEEPVMAAKNATDDGMQDATPFDPDAGVWFGLGDDGTTSIPVDDQRGALPYDTYTVEELACPANEGLQLLEVSVVISKDNHVIDLGTLDDPQASIGTAARDGEDGDSVMPCSEEAVIVDKVNYANLIPGREYTMSGRLMDKDGAPLTDDAGNEIVSETTFVPEAQTGYVELSFSLSTLQMEGASIVAFEQLIADGRLVASHEDLEDTDQSVSVAEPSVGTSASDTSDGDGVVTRSSQVSITDRVSYSGLNPGNSYVIEGTLMDKASGAPLVVSGEDVTSHLDFVPESSSGVVEMTFEFDAMNLEDTSQLVVFERLLEQDRLIASHEDLQDMGQTVVVAEPSVHTTLSDSVDEDKTAGMSGVLHLVDNVSYNGLVPGKEYVLKGTLMDKESGEPAVDANGNAIIAETTFTPETEHGSTEVVFEFDGGNLGGHSVVAFEELQEEGRKVAAHADLDDESQTVTITKPSIATQACNATTGERTLETNAIAKVTDRVHITGVVPGNEYTVVGLLMDKKTGLPLAVTQTTGKAGATSNAATDSARMAKLWNEMLALADFSAPNPNQDGSIELDAARSLDYRAIGKMLEEHSNEFDHMVMQVGVVKPKSSSIDVNMGFEFSTENVTGQVVVFEALLESGTGKLLAVHADFGDSEQTLEIPAPPKPAEHTREANAGTYDSTGNLLTRYGWAFALVAALGCASGAYGIAQWRRNLS